MLAFFVIRGGICMKKIKKMFLAAILIISFNFVSLPQAAVASNVESYGSNFDPYGYCNKTGE